MVGSVMERIPLGKRPRWNTREKADRCSVEEDLRNIDRQVEIIGTGLQWTAANCCVFT